MTKKITIKHGEYTLEEIKKMFEEKKNIIKYKNGAVVYPLEEGAEYFSITSRLSIAYLKYVGDNIDKARLENKNIFLTVDEAEAYRDKIKIYNKIEKEITIINHENNWVADLLNKEQPKYYLKYYKIENLFGYSYSDTYQYGDFYMCREAVEWLLSDQVTDVERQIWLEGI